MALEDNRTMDNDAGSLEKMMALVEFGEEDSWRGGFVLANISLKGTN